MDCFPRGKQVSANFRISLFYIVSLTLWYHKISICLRYPLCTCFKIPCNHISCAPLANLHRLAWVVHVYISIVTLPILLVVFILSVSLTFYLKVIINSLKVTEIVERSHLVSSKGNSSVAAASIKARQWPLARYLDLRLHPFPVHPFLCVYVCECVCPFLTTHVCVPATVMEVHPHRLPGAGLRDRDALGPGLARAPRVRSHWAVLRRCGFLTSRILFSLFILAFFTLHSFIEIYARSCTCGRFVYFDYWVVF